MHLIKSLFIIIIGGIGFFVSSSSLLANSESISDLKELNVLKKDSTDKIFKRKTNRNARIAAACSALLPGAGQVYNRKWWKVPIIYAAVGGVGYFFIQNDVQYKAYKNEIIYRVNNPNQVKNYPNYSIDNLVTQKNSYRKFRDLTVMGLSLVYVLNILDAYVDGHLKKFDMSDDLSLRIKPFQSVTTGAQPNLALGLTFQFTFK